MPSVTGQVDSGTVALLADGLTTAGPVAQPGGVEPAPLGGGLLAASCIPFAGPTLDVLAALTDTGRNIIARGLLDGLQYVVRGFVVGQGGYNRSNPLQPTTINVAATDLVDRIFPAVGIDYEVYDRSEYANPRAVSFLCRIDKGEAIAGLGEAGLIVEIIDDPVAPANNGTFHLFAIFHTPLQAKTGFHVYVWRIVTQF